MSSGQMTAGRRVDHQPEDGDQCPFPRLQPGDYGKDKDGLWYARPPWKHASGCLGDGAGVKGHKVTEHEDGTITVSPSILITCYPHEEPTAETWHGFLERGIWQEC